MDLRPANRVQAMPFCRSQLLAVSGLGKKKTTDYGQAIFELLYKFVREHPEMQHQASAT